MSDFHRRFAEDQRDRRIDRLISAGMEDRAREIYGDRATDAVLAKRAERATNGER